MKKVAIGTRPGKKETAQLTPEEWLQQASLDTQEQAQTEPMKRLTIDVPLSLHTSIKIKCAQRNSVMADEIRALLKREYE